MISQGFPPHNVHPGRTRRTAGPALLVLAAALLAGGCNRDRDLSDRTPEPPAADARDCSLSIDTSVWEVFRRTGERIIAGEDLTRQEIGAFTVLPMTALWCGSTGTSVPTEPFNLTNWMEEAFSRELGLQGGRKMAANRLKMAMDYRFSFDHRAEVDSLLLTFAAGDSACRLKELLDRWIDPANLPDSLTIAFLPGGPEIRAVGNVILVDTGLLAAGGRQQTLGQIAGLAYRWFQIGQKPNPTSLEGEEALASSLVKVRDEGIAAWISNRPFTYFNSQHPVLGKVNIIPESYLKMANLAVAYGDSMLPRLFADHRAMELRGHDFPRRMASSEGFTDLGYCMAAVIDGRLGTDRLVGAARTASGFLDAYQEAASLNPLPRPEPGATGHPWYASLSPFDEALHRQLHDLLVRRGL